MQYKMMEIEAVRKLMNHQPNWKHANYILELFRKGEYRIYAGTAPDEYDEHYSEICWGWLVSSPQTDPIVAVYARGERGNEPFDDVNNGLVIWLQDKEISFKNQEIVRAAKALVSRRMGFGEFKRIVRDNS